MRYYIPAGTDAARYFAGTEVWEEIVTDLAVTYGEIDMIMHKHSNNSVMYFRLPEEAHPYTKIEVAAADVEQGDALTVGWQKEDSEKWKRYFEQLQELEEQADRIVELTR